MTSWLAGGADRRERRARGEAGSHVATTGFSIDSKPLDDEVGESRLRDYRLAEFFSSLATAVDLLRETVDEMERDDGFTEAGEHAYRAARSAVAALASAEMSFCEDDGAEPESFADYYHAIGEAPPPGARGLSQFPAS